MKKINDWDKIEAAGEFKQLPAGGYIIKLLSVHDVPAKEYLEFTYDIAFGDYKGYFKDAKYPARLFRSYKATAEAFFKAFITAVEESNNFVFTFDENSLVGKYVGVILGEEEYRNSNGETKVHLQPVLFLSGQRIKAGDFKVPPLKKLRETISTPVAGQSDLAEISDEDLPF